jgi:MSHA biogenesis protein MshG
MGTFQYKARDKFNKPINGVLSASSIDLVSVKLKSLGYIPISILPKEEEAAGSTVDIVSIRAKVAFSEVNAFTRQFYILQKSGIPLLSAVRALKEETKNQFFGKVISQIGADIEAGLSLSASLEKYPQIFNKMYTNMIKVGETSGRLSEILERLVILGERDERIQMRIKSATRYPIIVITALSLGFIFLTTFVIPRFAKIFSQYHVKLPLPTRFLIGVNILFTKFWWLVIILAAAAVFCLSQINRTEKGKSFFDALKLKVPVFGPLILKLLLSRFTRITAILLASGVPILQVLGLASEGAGNVVVARVIDSTKISVNQGKGMLAPMKESKIFPPVVIQMVSVGEETGQMSQLLTHVADYYDEQIDYTINNMVTLIEPILIFVLGCGVLVMALGIFLPMWNLMSLFKK